MSDAMTRVANLKTQLELATHLEGGWFRRIHPPPSSSDATDARHALSAIHYLLAGGETSAWHRIDAEEAWHHVEGAPLELLIHDADNDRVIRRVVAPFDTEAEAAPLHVVPAGAWQAARSLGAYSLVTCLVAPEFVDAGFELLRGGQVANRLAKALDEAGVAALPGAGFT